jgi:hypothetical protein
MSRATSQPTISPTPQRDPVPSLAHEVIALFADALADVRFPELDRERLEQLAAAARAAQLELERVEDALLQAQARVAEQAAVLLAGAERGLAYARVFAQGDDALSERLAQLGSKPASTGRREEAVKRRARKTPGQRSGGAALFSEEAGSPAGDDRERDQEQERDQEEDGVAA